ncbi:hypothetical protein Q5762_19480 [Streptomyces sp. P9(2023)]|uniref:hypothetical protein n=1 Tax=Streptomyces sp. P9(2023) TaxID=3064394 RepID=UPI0028F42FE5|nr:hypothetical protein [Streptomyces sp. P9(2023)]MDT9690486.1 hypothetical protein [Streptomyces sp. P9(2023)]
MVRRRVALVTLVWGAGGLVAGGLWWWAVLRLALVPDQAGLVEGAVAAGGWGLSLLPVHVTASAAVGGRTRAGSSARAGPVTVAGRGGATRVTTASRRRRWGGGSDPS